MSHSAILRIQQEIKISGETVSPTILLLQYMQVLSKCDNLKSFIAPKMIDLIILPDNNIKSSILTWVNIHDIYCYL